MLLEEVTDAQLSEDVSETSTDLSDFCSEDESILDESFLERVQALKDIIPGVFRAKIYQKVTSFVSAIRSILRFGGKTLWVLATSVLLLGTPLVLAIEEEEKMIAYDKEFKMQQKAHEVLAPGTSSAAFSPPVPQRSGSLI
ncbi:hypothetical protein T552_00896 [Pneumocystis carinii B80]|uniref:Mitochondrial import receptor subunit tom22 n=1 Tax=Pneumocystis carinii (strain B80) TaxID=1408658 RepID=A0A0W4ZMS9_PNEC8|nr:hypothetical protein T552_00896 [Pneumocystis carinii B80]KTW29688.1 hypothetical protein T552_00896 [Pneumocystis carinii B80]